MWELDYKESWAPKNCCFWTVVLEKTLESPLDCKEIQSVQPKGNQSWIFIEGLRLKLKFQYFGHLMWRTDSLEKTLMLGKTEDRRKRGTTEDEMVGWHHWLYGHEFEWALGVGDGQGGLACCSPWSHRVEHDWATELWGRSSPGFGLQHQPQITVPPIPTTALHVAHQDLPPPWSWPWGSCWTGSQPIWASMLHAAEDGGLTFWNLHVATLRLLAVGCRIALNGLWMGFPPSSVSKEFTCNAGDPGISAGVHYAILSGSLKIRSDF